MKPESTRRGSTALTRQMIPVIERLEPRTMRSAALVHPTGAPSAANAATRYPVSDIFGAAAGVAIWQGGQSTLPTSPGSTSPGAYSSSSNGSLVSGTEIDVLLGSASVSGSPAIFSLLPVLPPDGLAAEIVGMIDSSQGDAAAIFNNISGAIGNAGSHGR